MFVATSSAEAGLEDRDFTALERHDPPGILVDAGDMMAEIGKTGCRNEADITSANHGDAHKSSTVLNDMMQYKWNNTDGDQAHANQDA
jgi:hypothetical protein